MDNSSIILDRIMQLKSIRTDTKLAEFFNVSQNTVSNWRSRDTLPFRKVIEFCDNEGITLDFIFHGRKIGNDKDIALLRTLDICGEEYKRRVYIAASVRAQNVLDEKKLKTKEKLQVKKDLEILSTASIE